MIKITGIRLSCPGDADRLKIEAAKKLGISDKDIRKIEILKESLDARRRAGCGDKPRIAFEYSVAAELSHETDVLKKCRKDRDVSTYKRIVYRFPYHFDKVCEHPPVIVGSGPAGLFCGLFLAEAGLRPVILERGDDIVHRRRKVEEFWETGRLDKDSNVQFGEGGAGTFSDGKLNTATKDKYGMHRKVLEVFVSAGAPPDILYKNKPHLGTDLLAGIVRNMRTEIERCGGTVLFRRHVTEFLTEDGRSICGVRTEDGNIYQTDRVVLAIGHSARDTFAVLRDMGVRLEKKPFAMGVRIEHPQKMINESQYGTDDPMLPPADYKLTAHTAGGRSVYSFCMCPGGYVVNASSEEGMCVVNGMSSHSRNGHNANSAIVVNVRPEDIPGDDPLSGVEFQRKWEMRTYQEGQGNVPVQIYQDFLKGRASGKFGGIMPEHKGKYRLANVRNCLPAFVSESICEVMPEFGRKIHGFDRPDAVISGIEARTSSPVRILRDVSMQSSLHGLFPCGEGAGYAGGITSAAVDGIRAAEAVAASYEGGEIRH